jgi:hypothetical protein
MPTTDLPSKHCELVEQADLSGALDALGVESLPFEEDRAYVIYGQAILKLIVTEGQLSGAQAFDIECWDTPDDGPEAVLAAFRDEVQTAINDNRSVR